MDSSGGRRVTGRLTGATPRRELAKPRKSSPRSRAAGARSRPRAARRNGSSSQPSAARSGRPRPAIRRADLHPVPPAWPCLVEQVAAVCPARQVRWPCGRRESLWPHVARRERKRKRTSTRCSCSALISWPTRRRATEPGARRCGADAAERPAWARRRPSPQTQAARKPLRTSVESKPQPSRSRLESPLSSSSGRC